MNIDNIEYIKSGEYSFKPFETASSLDLQYPVLDFYDLQGDEIFTIHEITLIKLIYKMEDIYIDIYPPSKIEIIYKI